MLVKELKNTIDKYKKDEKDKIIIELYKRIPKSIKEEYDIDNFIINFRENKKITKEEKIITISELKHEITSFIDCANKGLYSSPNKVISKSERSKWRFKVIRFYKELNSFKPDSEDGIIATDLLKDLFFLLSHGSCYLLFTNWETFRAIRISQDAFLETIMKRKLACGASKDNLKYCTNLLHINYDPYGYHVDVLNAFASCLKTTDVKYMAIDLLKESVLELNNKVKTLKKEKKGYYNEKELNNYIVECIMIIYVSLSETSEAINYYHKYYVETFQEIKEFILLNFLDNRELYKDFIIEYEKHLGKISYRDSLKERYEELKRIQ